MLHCLLYNVSRRRIYKAPPVLDDEKKLVQRDFLYLNPWFYSNGYELRSHCYGGERSPRSLTPKWEHFPKRRLNVIDVPLSGVEIGSKYVSISINDHTTVLKLLLYNCEQSSLLPQTPYGNYLHYGLKPSSSWGVSVLLKSKDIFIPHRVGPYYIYYIQITWQHLQFILFHQIIDGLNPNIIAVLYTKKRKNWTQSFTNIIFSSNIFHIVGI